jgi:glycosyltransferase involved in cell wall biosynthesis
MSSRKFNAMKVAAVIPVRNRPAQLSQALRSVQLQSHPVTEIIVVDDASTDETATLALTLAAEDRRIRLLRHSKRRGGSASRNTGWNASDADWIAFLDSDDEWLPEKLERQVEYLKGHGSALACFTGCQARGDIGGYRPPKAVSLFDLQRSNILGTTSTALVSRFALAAIGGFDENLPSCQDWDVWIKLRKQGEILVIPDPLVFFEQGGKDRISKNYVSVIEGHRMLFERILKEVDGLVPRLRVRASHHARMSQIMLDDFGEPFQALVFSVRSGLRWPNGHAAYFLRRSLKKLAQAMYE